MDTKLPANILMEIKAPCGNRFVVSEWKWNRASESRLKYTASEAAVIVSDKRDAEIAALQEWMALEKEHHGYHS